MPNAIQPIQTQYNPRFRGAGLPAGLLSSVVKTAEGNVSWGKFWQDTGSVWAPKFLVARSGAERAELSFLEFIESFFFYFACPFFGNKVFKDLMHRLSGSDPQIGKYLVRPLKEAPKALHGKLVPVKAAVIIASAGVIVGEYCLSFARNLFTEKFFNKSKFSDIVSLSEGEIKKNEITEARKKSIRRIKQCLSVGAGMIAGGALLALTAGKIKALQGPLTKLARHWDFSFTRDGSLALSKSQLRAVILSGVIGYHDAARDNLEFWEVFTRVALVVAPYLAFGDEMIQGWLAKALKNPGLINKKLVTDIPIEETWLKKLFGKDFVANRWLEQGRQVKSLGEIEKPLQELTSRLAKQGKTASQIAANAEVTALKALRSAKLKHFTASKVIGIVGVGIITTLLSQLFTRIRYHRAKQAKQPTFASEAPKPRKPVVKPVAPQRKVARTQPQPSTWPSTQAWSVPQYQYPSYAYAWAAQPYTNAGWAKYSPYYYGHQPVANTYVQPAAYYYQ